MYVFADSLNPRARESEKRGWPLGKSFRELTSLRSPVAVAVGIPVTRHPPHGSVRALISAYGS